MRSSYSILQILGHVGGAISISPWIRHSDVISTQTADSLYIAHTIDVPIDHFHNDSIYEPHTSEVFPMRYWFDDRFYEEGGPVIVLASGETSGANRLQYLQKGIAAILAEATSGIAVVLEHRYYGKSFPVANLSRANMRFLTTDQAMADTVFFAQNIKFPGLEHIDLTAKSTPYIAYGGSYAGAFVAFLRKLYPDTFWGAISSSGVTAAIIDYWEYLEAARLYAPENCALLTQKMTHIVDNIFLSGEEEANRDLKHAFGFPAKMPDPDFAYRIAFGILGLQSENWDPELSYPGFQWYCGNLTSSKIEYPDVAERLNATVSELIAIGGYKHETDTVLPALLNYIGYLDKIGFSSCSDEYVDECNSNFDVGFFTRDDIGQTWRSWLYQVCTQWGYFITGSGVPEDQLPLISRIVDLEYTSLPCKYAFNITSPPDVEAINKHGSFNFSYPRVAIIDGERDPWRAATPHKIGLPERKSSIAEPFLLIPGGVHHWDENSLFKNETNPRVGMPPDSIRFVQREEVKFVKAWLEEWKEERIRDQLPSSGEL